jgi:uncharacterized protein with HEPN domain
VRGDRDRLQDILESIVRIERYTNAGRNRFDADELVQTWVLYHLIIIGEAVRALSDELKVANPSVPWALIARTRNIVVHVYFGVNLDRVWVIVEHDLGALKGSVTAILEAPDAP